MLIFAGWVPQYWSPSVRVPRSRLASRSVAVDVRRLTPSRIAHFTGLRRRQRIDVVLL